MRFYRPELDVLRFVAFMMVFVTHTAPDPSAWDGLPLGNVLHGAVTAGAYGVDLFFALSAYLLTALLRREASQTGRIAVWRFYARRALRIWPLYFVFLALAPLFSRFIPGEELPPQYLAAFLLFVGNWACVAWGYPSSVVSPLWSVSIEEQFYVAWPLLMRQFSNVPLIAIVLVLASTAMQAVALLAPFQELPEHTVVWCNTLARLQPIAIGAWLATVRLPNLAANHRIIVCAIAISLLLLCGRFGGVHGPDSLWTYPAVALASGLLIVATLDVPIAWSPLVYLGKISYGLYVFHALAIALVLRQYIVPTVTEYALRSLGALVLTIAIAAISYRFLEKPFLQLKERFAIIHSRPA